MTIFENKNSSAWSLNAFIATGFFTGYIPYAPGTLGSLLALFFLYFLLPLTLIIKVVVFLFLLIIGFWSVTSLLSGLREKDPSYIVIDEICGLWVLLFIEDLSNIELCLAFIIFRILDIFKPGPIGWADRNLAGAMGVMIDDLLAGVFTLIIIGLGQLLLL